MGKLQKLDGPLPAGILKLYPEMLLLVQRQDEVETWDNPDFRAGVRAAKRNKS
jgi:hypothetical protein